MRRASALRSFLMAVALSGASALAQSAGDSVELISGQIFHGTVADPSLAISSGMGTIDVPIERVASVVCQTPPLVGQSLTLRDGDEFVGWLSAKTLHFTDDDGKTIELPMGQISRVTVAFRPPAGLPTPATMPGVVAIVYGLGGDHFQAILPASIAFRTRWGELNIDAQHVQQIVLSNRNQAAHQLVLSDGSEFSGIITAQTLALNAIDSPAVVLAAPVGGIAKIVCVAPDKTPTNSPKLEMAGGDVLRGAPQGTVTLQTQFGDLPVAADDIAKLATDPESPGDISLTLKDGRVVRAAAPHASVQCKLVCGLMLDLPVGMITAYTKSAPAGGSNETPTTGTTVDANTVDQVQTLMKQLANQNNGAVRVRAQNQLAALGKPILGLLSELRPAQPPRVQRQIDTVVGRIQGQDQ